MKSYLDTFISAFIGICLGGLSHIIPAYIYCYFLIVALVMIIYFFVVPKITDFIIKKFISIE